jgi:hypothetical protein
VSVQASLRNGLRDLNVAIGTAEKEHDVEFLRDVLHDDLVFRRADGTVVGKDEYLGALQDRTYDVLDVEISDVDAGIRERGRDRDCDRARVERRRPLRRHISECADVRA